MTPRTFKDRNGKIWDSKGARTPVAAEFAYGWRCFQCGEEKRRLAPVPEGWQRAGDEVIEQWCCVVKAVVRRNPNSMRGAGGVDQ